MILCQLCLSCHSLKMQPKSKLNDEFCSIVKKTCQRLNCWQYISNIWLELFRQLMDNKHYPVVDYPHFLQTTINPSTEMVDRTNKHICITRSNDDTFKVFGSDSWWTWNIRSSASSRVFLRESTSEGSFKHTLMQAVTFSSPAPSR